MTGSSPRPGHGPSLIRVPQHPSLCVLIYCCYFHHAYSAGARDDLGVCLLNKGSSRGGEQPVLGLLLWTRTVGVPAPALPLNGMTLEQEPHLPGLSWQGAQPRAWHTAGILQRLLCGGGTVWWLAAETLLGHLHAV